MQWKIRQSIKEDKNLLNSNILNTRSSKDKTKIEKIESKKKNAIIIVGDSNNSHWIVDRTSI